MPFLCHYLFEIVLNTHRFHPSRCKNYHAPKWCILAYLFKWFYSYQILKFLSRINY